jgi:hypothetical protein
MIPSFSQQFLHLQVLVKELTSEFSTLNIYCCSCVYYTSGFHRRIFWTVLDKKSNRWIGLWAPDLQHHVAAHWSKYRNLLHADCGLARIYNTARSFDMRQCYYILYYQPNHACSLTCIHIFIHPSNTLKSMMILYFPPHWLQK